MNSGGRCPASVTTVRCRYCSTTVTVSQGECAVQCSQCNCVTRVVPRCPSRLPVPGRPMMPTASTGFPCARGSKRAVLIGISYAGMRPSCGELRGPINDVKCMRHLLTQRFGFPSDCVLMLTMTRRTRAGCRPRTTSGWRCTGWCRAAAAATPWCSTSLAWARRSPTATATRPTGSTRPSARWTRSILDDEINEAIVRPLVPRVKLHAVVDACHSETVLDLSFLCRASRCGSWQWQSDHRPRPGVCKGTSGGQAVLISGYSDGKSKLSVVQDAYATVGAMTHSFIRTLECEPRGLTYGRLLASMTAIMRQGGGTCNLQGPCGTPISKVANFSGVQEPQLSSSEMFDIHCKPFVL
ncbi:hypothetical protein ACP4OV_012430 [Aristida adscensionis]